MSNFFMALFQKSAYEQVSQIDYTTLEAFSSEAAGDFKPRSRSSTVSSTSSTESGVRDAPKFSTTGYAAIAGMYMAYPYMERAEAKSANEFYSQQS